MRTIGVLVLVIASVLALPRIRNEPIKPRIVDGEDAERYQFPHMVSIHVRGKHQCGGAIISPTAVVSAAHCFITYDEIIVFAGLLDQGEAHPDNQVRGVAELIPHPDWPIELSPTGKELGPGLYNDIVILKLVSPLIFNEAVQPISLPKAGEEANGLVTLSGWGLSGIAPEVYPTRMQFLEMPIIPNDECNQRFLENGAFPFLVIETQMCTLPNRAGQSACHSDSGGPLVQDGVLVGVVHGGSSNCGVLLPEESPNVFTKVSSFVDFIKQNTPDL